MRTGIGLNFSRAGNLAGIKQKIPPNVQYGKFCILLGEMVENDKILSFDGFLTNYVNH